jgi:hypothetical protein
MTSTAKTLNKLICLCFIWLLEMAVAQTAALEALDENHNSLREFQHLKAPAFSGISNRNSPCLSAATNTNKMAD